MTCTSVIQWSTPGVVYFHPCTIFLSVSNSQCIPVDRPTLIHPACANQVPLPERCLRTLVSSMTPDLLAELSARQAAEVAWALGVLQYRPDAEWWASYEALLLADLDPRHQQQQTTAALMESAGVSGSSRRRLVDLMPGKQLGEVAWACATLRRPPSARLLSVLASAAARELPTMAPSSLSNLLWSLTDLDPSGESFGDGGSGASFSSASFSSSAATPSSASRLKQQQQQQQLQLPARSARRSSLLLSRHFEGRHPAPSAGTSTAAAAEVGLTWRTWMDMWLSEASGKMPGFEPQDLAMVASALAASRCKPRQDWMAKFLAQALARVDECRWGGRLG